MRKMMMALALAVAALLPQTAQAAAPICDQLTTGLRLCLPRYGTSFDNWARADINALTVINSSVPYNSTTTVATFDWLQVRRISGVSTGTANVWMSSPTIVSVATAPIDSTFVLTSSGSLLAQSTSSTAGHPVLAVRNNAGTNIARVNQDGSVTLVGPVTATTFASSTTITGAGGLGITYGVTAGSVTALAYSSAPVINTSTISSTGALAFYTQGGVLAFRCSSSADNCGVGPGASSIIADWEVTDSNDPTTRIEDTSTSVSAGDEQGSFDFADSDSSTGGSTVKAAIVGVAREGWSSSDNQMEVNLEFEFSRRGGTRFTGVIMNSSGVVVGRAGDGADVAALASTETLHVYGAAGFSTSIQASSGIFSGTGGAHALTLSTGAYVATGKLQFGAGGFIQFSDGSTLATAPGAASQVLYSSKSVQISQQNISATVLGVAFTTVTLNVAAGDYFVWVNMNNAGALAVCGVLFDGAFFGGQSTSRGILTNNGTGSSIEVLSGFTVQENVSAGTHSWALTCRVESGSTQVAYNGINLTENMFGIYRVR